MTPSVTESIITTVLRSFLMQVLPAGTEVFKGQANLVPEPTADNFVMMVPSTRTRLATNTDIATDATMIGSISGSVLDVTAVGSGSVTVGAPVFGEAVLPLTYVTGLGTGSGGLGTYIVSPSQTVASGPIAFGQVSHLTSTRVAIQLDFHGEASTDNTQIVMSLFRDAYACDFFTAAGYDIQPLYVSEPQQAPFINGEDQYEDRWTLDVVVQANPTVSTPQQFADTLSAGLIGVGAAFPPGD
jgi:hypothetical protein